MDLDKYLRKRQKLKDSRDEILRLSVSGEEFEFKKLDDDKYEDIYGRITEVNQSGDNSGLLDICRDLVYFSLPDLHDPELLESMQVSYPPDAVREVFSPGEIDGIGAELIKWNGMADSDDIKKV